MIVEFSDPKAVKCPNCRVALFRKAGIYGVDGTHYNCDCGCAFDMKLVENDSRRTENSGQMSSAPATA